MNADSRRVVSGSQERTSWRSRPRQGRRRVGRYVALAIVVLGAAVVVFPFFWQLTSSLKSPAQLYKWPPVWIPWPLHFSNYAQIASVVPILTYLKNSLTIVLPVIIGTEISCALAAYGFARLRFPGRQVIFMLLVASMIVPSYATLMPQFIAFQRIGWYNTFYPLIVPAFFGNAFYIFLLRQYLLGISPELEDAARIDGAGFLKTFAVIILPLSKPALATVAIFSFVFTWNDFFGPLVYLSNQQRFTLPLGLVFFQGSPHSTVSTQLLMGMSVLIAVPCIALYFWAQRLFIQGVVFSGVKG